MAWDEVGLYRWVDDSGALHFGSGSQVPPRLRRRAVPVSASVGVVPVDPAPPDAAAPAASPAAAPATAPGAQPAATPAASETTPRP
jgi:hypothetical protein